MSRKTHEELPREVVLAEDLAAILQKLIDAEMDAYAVMTGNPRENSGAIARLSAQSGIPERRIYGILHGENCSVDLDYADRLLLAFDRFVELELPDSIVPETEVRRAATEQTQMMRQWCRARGRVWPTDRKGMRTEPVRVRKEVWAAERGQRVA